MTEEESTCRTVEETPADVWGVRGTGAHPPSSRRARPNVVATKSSRPCGGRILTRSAFRVQRSLLVRMSLVSAPRGRFGHPGRGIRAPPDGPSPRCRFGQRSTDPAPGRNGFVARGHRARRSYRNAEKRNRAERSKSTAVGPYRPAPEA